MKKLLFLALLAFVGVSCFAEVKVKRMMAPSNISHTNSVYWNSSYFYPEPKPNAADLDESIKHLTKEGVISSDTSMFCIGSRKNSTAYTVNLSRTGLGYWLQIYFSQGGFIEQISVDHFYDYNSAKREYDRYCAKYKEYVRKNYTDR